MGEIREVDAISDAIIATENEIAGNAWDIEDTDPADGTGDRTLESIGEGLEGQHEAEEDEAAEGSEEQEGSEESEVEEGETDGERTAEAAAEEGTEQGEQPGARAPQGFVPSGKLREANERTRALTAERDDLRKQLEAKGNTIPEIEGLKAQLAAVTQELRQRPAPTAPVKADPPAPVEAPDIFENPKGFVDHLQQGIRTELGGVMKVLRDNAVATSFELAHIRHGAAFDNATAAINKLDPNNAEHRSLVAGIYSAPNPGEALVSWHKRNETFARVGNDPAAFEERIRTETRESLLKDPEFIKQVVAAARGDAARGENGSPRNQTRLPPSLARANGASPSSERVDHSASDGSEQAVADAAWR